MTAQKPHSDHSDKKRTQEFLPEIQAMIKNNPSKSIGSIVRNMGMSEFLIRQIVHKDIWYSLYNKEPIFIKDHEKQEKRKLWNKLKHVLQVNILWFFSDEKNFCQDQIMNSQNSCWLSLFSQDVPILMKSKHPVHIMVFGVVRLNMKASIKCLEEVVLDQEDGCWKILYLTTGCCVISHRQENPVLAVGQL